MTANRYIGQNVPRVDGWEKVTGKAVFATDVEIPGMLVGRALGSPHAAARIRAIDTGAASRLPGVRAVINAADVTQFRYGPAIADELALADGVVRYAGEPVAAVAADDDEIAALALDLINVEYEVQTPLLEVPDAMRPGVAQIHPERDDVAHNVGYHFDFVRGDGARGFDEADVIVEDRFSTQAQYHAYLEPQVCVAQWETSGKLTIWASSQQPFKLRDYLAAALGIPEHQVRVVRPYVGGGFGGKLYLRPHYIISSLLSRAAARPVKICYSRAEDFVMGRPRMSEDVRLKLGFKRDGSLVAKEMRITADGGAYMDACPNMLKVSMTNPAGIYRLRHIVAEGSVVYTNKVPRTAFRGYGVPEVLFAVESLMDVAAEKLGLDPLELRLRNCSQQGDVTAHGWILNSCGLSETIKIVAEKSDWARKKQERRENIGIGAACQINLSGQRALHPAYDGSAAVINLDQWGRARVISGETDIGQGTCTVFAQIAAEASGLSLDDVTVVPHVDTDIAPYAIGTSASRVTTLGGNAVRLTGQNLKAEILRHAAAKLGLNANVLEVSASVIRRHGEEQALATVSEIAYDVVFRELGGGPISVSGHYVVPDYVVLPDAARYGNPSVGYAFSTQVAEVSVDPDTGQVTVLDVWVAQDLGRAINPRLCEGQIEGGVVQGMGYGLTEDYRWQDGVVITPDFRDYKKPLSAGIPRIHVSLVETMEPAGPYGAKSLAEAAMNPTAVAIANAVYDAVGVRIKDLPLTAEKVLRAIQEKRGAGGATRKTS